MVSTFNTQCKSCESIIKRRASKTGMYFCNVKCKADWQRTQKPVDKEWLVKKYTDERLDATQIGMLVGRDAKSVWNWLVGYGIPTRRRGYASSEHWMAKGDISLFKGKTHSNETKNKLRQIAIADGRVPFNKEKGPFYKGKRGSDIPSWKGGVTPERQAFYSAIEWKKVVREVWVRDNATCQRCKVRKSDDRSLSFDIHHIVSFAFVGLRSELSNLVLLCEPCHYWVHSSGNIDKLFIKKEPSNG